MKFRMLLLIFALLVIAVPILAAETKPVPEVDALRLEKSEAVYQKLQSDIQVIQERMERIKEQTQSYIREIGKRDGVEGWTLNMQQRRWEKPEPQTQPPAKPGGS